MDYSEMTHEELEVERRRLEDDLADYEEMAQFHFSNTSDHINAQDVKRERERMQRLKDKIAELGHLLARSS